MSNLQPHYHFKLDFQNLYQHRGGPRHLTPQDNQLHWLDHIQAIRLEQYFQ